MCVICATLVLVVLLLCLTPASGMSGEPIVIGTFPAYSSTDFLLKQVAKPAFDAVRASVAAVNRGGGIFGRPLQLVECESALAQDKMVECAANMTRDNPTMLAWVGVFTDVHMDRMQPIIAANELLVVGPWLITNRYRSNYFTTDWIFTSSKPQVRVFQAITTIFQRFHVRRVGIVAERVFSWASGDQYQIDISAARSLMTYLGIEFSGTLWIDTDHPDIPWYGEDYDSFLAARPQAIFILCSPTTQTYEVFTDLVNRTSFGANVDPNLLLIVPDIFAPVAELSLLTLKARRVPFNPKNRLFFMFANPALTDSSNYFAMSRAQNELRSYLNGSTAFLNTVTSVTMGAFAWIETQVLISILRSMNPLNISRQAMKDKVFNSGSFVVDDLYFGMYNYPCFGIRKQIDQFCECNEGYRMAEIYGYDPDVVGKLFSISLLRSSYPITICHPENALLTPTHMLVLLKPNVSGVINGEVFSKAGEAMLQGLLAAEMKTGALSPFSFEFAQVNGSSSIDLVAAVDKAMSDRFVSAVVAVVTSGSPEGGGESYPILDPVVFPAVLKPPYLPNVLYTSATLEQEIFALAQYASKLALGFRAVAKGLQADSIGTAASLSASTFNVNFVEYRRIDAEQSFSSVFDGSVAANVLTLITGITSAVDTASLLQQLNEIPTAIVALSFEELSVLYDDFSNQCQSAYSVSPGPCERLIFATSLRNWNAPQIANDSSVMIDYFTFTNETKRSPLSLRGFVNTLALRRVVSQISTALLPQVIIDWWYRIGLIVLGDNDYLGPYSNAPCLAAATAPCDVNTGARVLRVMSLANVTYKARFTNSSGASETTFLSSAVIYATKSQLFSFSTLQIAGIAVGGAAALVLAIYFICWARSGKRDNSSAPKEVSLPVTLMFTDIQSSTSLWARCPDVMGVALDTHHQLIRHLVRKHKCYEVKTIGDSFMIASSHASRSVALAVELQHIFFDQTWGTSGAFSAIDDAYRAMEHEKGELTSCLMGEHEYRRSWNGLRVRVGIHTGYAEIKFDETTKGFDYYGTASNVAARTESHGAGGQVCITQDTLDALGTDTKQYIVRPLGEVSLRGVPNPIHLYDIVTVPGRTFLTKAEQAERTEQIDEVAAVESTESGILDDVHFADPMGDWICTTRLVLTTALSAYSSSDRISLLNNLCSKWRTRARKNADEEAGLISAISRRVGTVAREKSAQQLLDEQNAVVRIQSMAAS